MFCNIKKILLILFLFFYSWANSQTVSGTVVDSNEEPILGASVYFDGTLYGTTTDIDGKFSFDIKSSINTSLVVSFLGYENIYLNDINFNNRYKFILIESVLSLKEVVVFNSEFTRKQMMSFFKKQFLGNTKAGKKCTIENEDELYFIYDKENFILNAFADKPLIIDNPFLGYKVYFDLKSFNAKFFKYSIKKSALFSSIYAGTSRFVETSNSSKIIKNREKTFKGSFLEFFRNFAKKDWTEDKFLLYYKSFQVNPNNYFTVKKISEGEVEVTILPQDQEKLKPKGFVAEFSLLYDRDEQSKIIFHTDNFVIDKYGLFSNYEKIYFSGALSEKKAGDLLPSNYGIEE
jgi:hypothetical protein